jgi:SAM-dependent methyltransferase
MEDDKGISMKCYACENECFDIVAEPNEMRFECFSASKQVVKCQCCDLVQLLPQWTEEELTELYSKYSVKEDFKGQTRKVKISEYLPKYIWKWEQVLEVGCGYGDNVEYLRQQGFHVTGIDKETGIDYRDYKGKADVVYAIHLFEHLPDPRHFVKWLSDTITSDGRFVLEMPSLDNPLLKLKAFRRFYWYPYHLFFYDKNTIKIFFPTVEVTLIQEYGLINHLRWLFKGKPGNWNPYIPVLDDIYKFILTKILGKGDTLLVVGDV